MSLTISVADRSGNDYYFPEEFVSPEVAVGMGYGESKWISEKILSVASSQTPLRPVIVRAGQISGGVNGCWNPLEWMPAVVQSAKLVKCLPSLDQVNSRHNEFVTN
jgi:thioester reductase-like protein